MFGIKNIKERLLETRDVVNCHSENIQILDSNHKESMKLFATALANIENIMAALSLRDILIPEGIGFGVKYVDNLLLQDNIVYFVYRGGEQDMERVEGTFEHCSEVALEWLDEKHDKEEIDKLYNEILNPETKKTKSNTKTKAKSNVKSTKAKAKGAKKK